MDGSVLELAGNVTARRTAVGIADERMLIRRAQRGDRAAFDELVRLHDRKVLQLAMRVVRSPEDARDIYQEAFLKVYRALPKFRFQASFSTWLYRIVMNTAMDYLRRQKSRKELPAPGRPEHADDFFHTVPETRAGMSPDRLLDAGEIRRRIGAALEELNPRERMVFELRHFEGLKLRAIGEMCDTSEETVKNCLFRATRKLRDRLGDLL